MPLHDIIQPGHHKGYPYIRRLCERIATWRRYHPVFSQDGNCSRWAWERAQSLLVVRGDGTWLFGAMLLLLLMWHQLLSPLAVRRCSPIPAIEPPSSQPLGRRMAHGSPRPVMT